MDTRVIALIVFACVFGSGMAGLLLGRLLPDGLLDRESKDIVKLASGLIGTLAALVLGLLISSAKGTFDEVSSELTHAAAKAVQLDRVLAQYGPATDDIRAEYKRDYTAVAETLISGDQSQQQILYRPESFGRFEDLQARIRALAPQADAQRGLQSRALEISGEMSNSRWLLTMQRSGSVSIPLLVTLVSWLSLIFAAWGMCSPRNLIVATTLFACALSVSGAVVLLLEMNQPLTGWIRVSPMPLQRAIAHIGE